MNRLDIYVNGVFSFMNKHTRINFNNKFVCFDIGDMPKQVKPVIMFLILDYVYMKMKKDIKRKLLVIDEAWSLLSRTEDASYIFEIVKTSRKFNLGLLMINQEVEGLLDSDAGKSVLANSAYTLLMRQKPAVIEQVQETFHLSTPERIYLLTANVGEGILIMEDEHSEIKIVAAEEEHKIITTNADEILKNEIEKREIEKQNLKKAKQSKSKVKKKKAGKRSNKRKQKLSKKSKVPVKPLGKEPCIKLTVDGSKGFYRYKDITLDDAKYLVHEDFKEFSFYSILSKEKEKYLLKLRTNESPQHLFLIHDIANYLKKFTKKIWTYQTVKPDIVFEINGKKYAIEVETGKMYKNNKRELIAKIKSLDKIYGKNWFFVVTDRNFFSRYRKLGETYTKSTIVNKIFRLSKNA